MRRRSLARPKVTGKANGWTYGGLTALTDREYALVETAAGACGPSGCSSRTPPTTSLACRRTCSRGSSNIGGHGTAVIREGDLDAYTGSVDYSLRWSQQRYTWNGQWSGTRAPIDGEMETGFGGVTNFNYNSKHLGRLRPLRLFQQRFQEHRPRFLFQSQQQDQCQRRLQPRAARSAEVLPECDAVFERRTCSTTATGCRSTKPTSWAARCSS